MKRDEMESDEMDEMRIGLMASQSGSQPACPLGVCEFMPKRLTSGACINSIEFANVVVAH